MSCVSSKNTSIEKKVRSLIHSLGYRFRIHRKDLPGNPDIFLPKYKIAIFVHGCFWHQHDNCRYSRRPKSNIDFWNEKLDRNIQRDELNYKLLSEKKIRVMVIWQCELKSIDKLKERIISFIKL